MATTSPSRTLALQIERIRWVSDPLRLETCPPGSIELCLRLRSTAADSASPIRCNSSPGTIGLRRQTEAAGRWISRRTLGGMPGVCSRGRSAFPRTCPWLERAHLRGAGQLDVTALAELLRSTAIAAQTGAESDSRGQAGGVDGHGARRPSKPIRATGRGNRCSRSVPAAVKSVRTNRFIATTTVHGRPLSQTKIS